MGFPRTFDTSETGNVLATPRVVDGGLLRHQADRVMLRFGGLAMDPVTGASSWRGRPISLKVDDRRLLSVLMRRAGQILGREQIASWLGVAASTIDARIERLTIELKQAGVSCLPCQVDGLGYVLWRC